MLRRARQLQNLAVFFILRRSIEKKVDNLHNWTFVDFVGNPKFSDQSPSAPLKYLFRRVYFDLTMQPLLKPLERNFYCQKMPKTAINWFVNVNRTENFADRSLPDNLSTSRSCVKIINKSSDFQTFQNKTRKNTTQQFPEKLTDNVFICINYKTSNIDKFIMNETWKTFTLTFVEYVENDDIGKLLAILSLSPLVIVIVFLTVFACKRDLHTCTFGIGTILNGVLNYVLKHTVKESRPTHVTNRLPTKLWEQYGWPSSHSQFMCFVSSRQFLHIL